jgi:hypothetical protein
MFPHEHLWKSNVRFIGPVEFSVEENGQPWTPVKTRFFVVTNLTMFIIKYGIKPGSEKVLPPKFAAQLKAVYRDEVSPIVELHFEDRKSSTFFAEAGDFAVAQPCKWRINTKKPAMDRIMGALTTCLAIANQPGNKPKRRSSLRFACACNVDRLRLGRLDPAAIRACVQSSGGKRAQRQMRLPMYVPCCVGWLLTRCTAEVAAATRCGLSRLR